MITNKADKPNTQRRVVRALCEEDAHPKNELKPNNLKSLPSYADIFAQNRPKRVNVLVGDVLAQGWIA